MKKRFLFALLTLSIYSYGQSSKHPIDVEYYNCIENAVPTTLGSITCTKEAKEAWELEIATLLEKLKKESKQLNVALLEESQTQWLAFHKANVKFYYSFYQIQYQGGTMARSAALTYEMTHLRERAIYLKELYEEISEK
ncbi:lysozyme inhibitor LprI family protein [Tenacibaculum sp. MEBiC06402]|uniref:lysozyme inhibitor LprI family protein n=1 Tax=unclassified Tenacibaculum TaxID=2635139 RepID=UPI003B9CF6A3